MAGMQRTVFVFDLDGTLVDSVYQHVLAWQEALEVAGIELAVWRIHRRIGMSGGLFTRAVSREIGHDLSDDQARELQAVHDRLFREMLPADERRPLPGAKEILVELRERNITHGIATSGSRPGIDASLVALE
ncbi:MAG TPA: HAD family hydrolase, partial [Actinomycetota bacterium]|nr:HAD family hydrolase [Actinomycetota bacterium]